MKYQYSCDKIISDLVANGYADMPSIQDLVEHNNFYSQYLEENPLSTYNEGSEIQLKLIKAMGLKELFDKLHAHGRDLGLNVDQGDHYLISRHVKEGQSSEGYRGHFDSHFITIVLPIHVPDKGKKFFSGELLAVPNARSQIKSEIINIIQKIWTKRYNKHERYTSMLSEKKAILRNFHDYRPFVFYGNKTFHGNFPLENCSSDRVTFLCHLHDTSPRYGIGAILRKLRNR